MWAAANILYFMSTNALTQAISYPISNSGPPIVASLWGIFLYKEVKGLRNFAFLLSGFAFAITGSVLVGVSF
jgi:glucose uptake protein GlcU